MDQSRLYLEAMASYPTGVTIVTTADGDGRWWGFTASAFCSVSLTPPLVLTCLSESAECFPAFERAERWNIHFLHSEWTELAQRFATRGADKFTGLDFEPDERGIPLLRSEESIALRCSAHAKVAGGDHIILLGLVEQTHLGVRQEPCVYFRRNFHGLVRAGT
jgi:flavin reductase ActVB